MKLNVKALALSFGILWAAAVLLVGIANMIWPTYGEAFLKIIAAIYPGYNAGASAGQVLIGTVYALIDGTIGGAVLAFVYNLFATAGPRTTNA